MEYIERVLSEYSYVIDVLKFALFVVISLLLFYKTKDIKYLKGALSVMIPRRNPNYQDTEKVSGQEFSNLKPVYRLNKASGELELTDEFIDITELVNSSKSIALDSILERFLPTDGEVSDLVVEREELQDDLDVMRESFELADTYRKKYGLDDLTPVSEVFKIVKERSQKVNDEIAKVEALKKFKEKIDNEKKVEPEGKSEKLPQSGEQNPS